jgi:hypothetical protein
VDVSWTGAAKALVNGSVAAIRAVASATNRVFLNVLFESCIVNLL